jgi:hypothetical protein
MHLLVNSRFIENPSTWSWLTPSSRDGSVTQTTISRSSTESEYTELVWLQSPLCVLGLLIYKHPSVLWCDNIGATYLSANPKFHERIKHIEVDFHFIWEQVANKELQIRFVPTKDQLADGLIKPLSQAPFRNFCFNLNMTNVPTLRLRGMINVANITYNKLG